MATQRIQKILAAAGFGSRRSCEQLVIDGRVSINGKTMRVLPQMADPESDRIVVDGRVIQSEKPVYFLLNKPAGVFCTHNDPSGRRRAVDLLVGVRERVYPVGRLDAESMGLLLLTNDGTLTQKLTHPRFGVHKTYRAEIAGVPSPATMERLRSGVWLSEGKTAPAQIKMIHKQRDRCILEITLRESRNRELRRMLAKTGHNVRRLTRISMGRLSIAGLGVGAFRRLTPQEVKYLYSLTEQSGMEDRGSRESSYSAQRPRRPRPARSQEDRFEKKAPAARAKFRRQESDRPRAASSASRSVPRAKPAARAQPKRGGRTRRIIPPN